MTKERILKKLDKQKKEIQEKFFVKEVGLFGSFVRKEQKITSDVDILVDFIKPIGWDVVDLQKYLEDILGIRVDLVLKKGLMRNKKLWKLIKPEILYV